MATKKKKIINDDDDDHDTRLFSVSLPLASVSLPLASVSLPLVRRLSSSLSFLFGFCQFLAKTIARFICPFLAAVSLIFIVSAVRFLVRSFASPFISSNPFPADLRADRNIESSSSADEGSSSEKPKRKLK